MTGRRGLLAAVTGCLLSGALVLVFAGRVWGRTTLTAATGARIHASVTGRSVAPALPALGLALLVLAGAVVAVRSWLRRLVGLIVVVVGGTAVGIGLTSRHDVAAALGRHAFAVSHATVHVSLSAWAVGTVIAGALAVAAGALTVIAGARWPALGARYETPAARPTADPASAAWEALDRGEDPTV
jgi:hypothetical protein